MAGNVHLWHDCYLSVEFTVGTESVIDDQATAITLPMTVEELDSRAMGDEVMIKEPGLFDYSVTLEFLADFRNNELDADVFAAMKGRHKRIVRVRPDSAALGANNPEYRATMFISAYNPGGSHGELAGGSITFAAAGDLTRHIT